MKSIESESPPGVAEGNVTELLHPSIILCFQPFPPCIFSLNVCDSPPSVRSGKMSRTKHCGGLRMFGVFVARPAGCIKREVEEEDEGG